MARSPEFGLLIDYEYCTGCHTCQVACAQGVWMAGRHGRDPGPGNRCSSCRMTKPT